MAGTQEVEALKKKAKNLDVTVKRIEKFLAKELNPWIETAQNWMWDAEARLSGGGGGSGVKPPPPPPPDYP